MECLEPTQLVQFVMQVANWFCLHFEEGQLVFGTDTAVFEWSVRENGMFCYDGERS